MSDDLIYKCPACGAGEASVSSHVETRSVCFYVDFHDPLAARGPLVEYQAVVDTCSECFESGDFDAVNDPKIIAAINESKERLFGRVGAA